MPSAAALVLFSIAAPQLSAAVQAGATHGLKLVAVAVVAQAVLGMARTLCPDRIRASIAVASVVVIAFTPMAVGQIVAIVAGAVAGFIFCNPATASTAGEPVWVSRKVAVVSFAVFLILLVGLPYLARIDANHTFAFLAAFYRSGALVFGGGHVVLPLLNDAVVARGWVRYDTFLAGYAAAQAIPGPLFSFAAYLGAVSNSSPNGWQGAIMALVAIFLPGFLILIAALPFWQSIGRRRKARAALAGVSAAVVGILAAALFDPLWISSVRGWSDFAAVAIAFTLLVAGRVAPVLVVALGVAFGLAFAGHL
jgi:chromate transporter